jgi:hypothetical protein
MYLFLSSNDCKSTHPENSVYDFTIDLPKSVLLNGQYECSMVEYILENRNENEHVPARMTLHSDSVSPSSAIIPNELFSQNSRMKESLYIFCDICETSYIKEKYLPILKIAHKYRSNYGAYYMNINTNYFNRIRVYIRDEHLNFPSFSVNLFKCTLHIRKKKKNGTYPLHP